MVTARLPGGNCSSLRERDEERENLSLRFQSEGGGRRNHLSPLLPSLFLQEGETSAALSGGGELGNKGSHLDAFDSCLSVAMLKSLKRSKVDKLFSFYRDSCHINRGIPSRLRKKTFRARPSLENPLISTHS